MKSTRIAYIAFLILFVNIWLISLSAWATKHAIGGGSRFSEGTRNAILEIADFPSKVKSVVGLVNHFLPPKGVVDRYSKYELIEKGGSELSGAILIPYISKSGDSELLMVNLSNGVGRKILLDADSRKVTKYSDTLVGSESVRQIAVSSRKRIWHPHIEKTGVLTYMIPWNDLISIDLKTARQRWAIRGAFHHSIEADSDGNLWACAAIRPGSVPNQLSKTQHSNKSFEDQALVKISTSGRILQTISIADLLCNCGLEYLLYGASNPNVNLDPIHLNQITPILSDSGVFRKGQLLVSLRNMSTILLVDPVTQAVVWHGTGPWMNQHCVFPVGSSEFSVLDNHSFASGHYWLNPNWRSRVVKCNITSKNITEIKINNEIQLNLQIPAEGRVLPIEPEAWLIEDSVQGSVMIFNNSGMIYKWVNQYPDGTVGTISWCRYLPRDSVPEFL